MTDRRFAVLLEPDSVAGGFTATVPAMPQIVTEGDSEEQALAMAAEAIALHLRYLSDASLPLPTEPAAPLLRSVAVATPNSAPR